MDRDAAAAAAVVEAERREIDKGLEKRGEVGERKVKGYRK